MNNNIEPHYVSYDFAKFLKSKGFNVPCKQAFYGDVEDEDIEYNEPTTTGDDFILGEYDYYAPEHWEVCDWLFKNYGIWIQVIIGTGYPAWWIWQIYDKDYNFYCTDDINKNLSFDSPEKAYNSAFDYIKKII